MDMFTGADGDDWSMWLPQDALDDQHHPLEVRTFARGLHARGPRGSARRVIKRLTVCNVFTMPPLVAVRMYAHGLRGAI
jgi:hypothetical protein